MELLAQRITDKLQIHKSCTIFETDLSRVWPYNDVARQQRYALIKAFANAHGWSATILDPGIRVTFRKLKPGETEAEPLKLVRAS